mmetsp:Transcript_29445/g.73311  ORF Transcript_29445/g.73311 Transcript_29445/m.73311 type:complete len:238 (+) Transcript_29445:213-926(+)
MREAATHMCTPHVCVYEVSDTHLSGWRVGIKDGQRAACMRLRVYACVCVCMCAWTSECLVSALSKQTGKSTSTYDVMSLLSVSASNHIQCHARRVHTTASHSLPLQKDTSASTVSLSLYTYMYINEALQLPTHPSSQPPIPPLIHSPPIVPRGRLLPGGRLCWKAKAHLAPPSPANPLSCDIYQAMGTSEEAAWCLWCWLICTDEPAFLRSLSSSCCVLVDASVCWPVILALIVLVM